MAATLEQTRTAARQELLAAGFARKDADAALALTRPALFYSLKEARPEDTIPLGASKIGGRPDLAESTPWPPTAASFLLQINLAELPDGVLDIALPREGTLSCFANRDSEALLIWNKPRTTLVRLPLPDSSKRYEARAMAATFVLTLDIDHPDLPAVDDDEIFDVIDDWSVPENGVQLGGNRKIIQRREARDMRLVLQIGTFEDIGMVWGTLGSLTISMREDDIAACRFDRLRSEVQSY
jgi:hypothetical protein